MWKINYTACAKITNENKPTNKHTYLIRPSGDYVRWHLATLVNSQPHCLKYILFCFVVALVQFFQPLPLNWKKKGKLKELQFAITVLKLLTGSNNFMFPQKQAIWFLWIETKKSYQLTVWNYSHGAIYSWVCRDGRTSFICFRFSNARQLLRLSHVQLE